VRSALVIVSDTLLHQAAHDREACDLNSRRWISILKLKTLARASCAYRGVARAVRFADGPRR
jgi:hypothetical protein